MSGGGSDSSAKAEIKAADERRRRLLAIKQINRVFGVGHKGNRAARDETLSNVRQDVINFYREKLDRQNKDTRRELGFELARRGQIGGSVQVDQQAELRRLRDEALIDIANKADQAKQGLKSQDEAARLSAIRDVNADVNAGSVLQGAVQHLRNSADQAYSEGVGQNIGNFFQDLAFLYAQNQGRRGFEDANAFYRGASSPSSSGSIRPDYGSVGR